jgi:hypothetical protein
MPESSPKPQDDVGRLSRVPAGTQVALVTHIDEHGHPRFRVVLDTAAIPARPAEVAAASVTLIPSSVCSRELWLVLLAFAEHAEWFTVADWLEHVGSAAREGEQERGQ